MWWVSPCLIGLQFGVVGIAVWEGEMGLFNFLPIITLATGAMTVINAIIAKGQFRLVAMAVGTCMFLLSAFVTLMLSFGAGGI